MPKAVSRRQFRFMKAVASGTATHKPKGLSPAEATEFVAGQNPADLPERAKVEPKRNSYRRRVR